jgi:hypothetical protein
VGGWKLTVREGPRVEHERFEDREAALAHLEEVGRKLQETVDRETVDPPLTRRFEPVQQVAARLELSGPGRVRAGVDVRGDGSAEGFTGRLRRRVVEQGDGESPYDALRRSLGG